MFLISSLPMYTHSLLRDTRLELLVRRLVRL